MTLARHPERGARPTAAAPRLLAPRLAALGLLVVVLQHAFISQVPVAGGTPDLTPLVVMAVGLLCGSLAGALFGFGLGLLVDVALLQTLGLSSLILLAVGYWCGRLPEAQGADGVLVPLAVGALATFATVAGYTLIEFLLDVEAPVGAVLVPQLLATMVLNALLALPLHALVRRWLRPAIPEEPGRRRRRATLTRLSPLDTTR
ncbi:MAG: rod shape-determining protein MreD [Actinomycetota bacterium]|nr:rod shape-determining protein MreD [Actinomycetota bacterium]